MPHQYLRTLAPPPPTLFVSFTGRYRQALTYPNKPLRIITGFSLGDGAYGAAKILNSKSEEEIGQSTTLGPLLVKPEYELWSKLSNNINLRAQ